ncbi:MAG: YitT family protein, partial [Clostridia bacterium]|nr:YitT family protein [Clostridia bacterium]
MAEGERMKINREKIIKSVKAAFFILAGNALLAFLVAAFVIPHDIIMGGTTGIGIVLGRVLPVETALIVLILNVVLLLAGLFVLGKKFFLTTVASSLLYPVFLGLMQRIPGIGGMTDNELLSAIFAGVLMGLSLGMVMRVGSSTGGMDILNLMLHKWFHLPVAVFVTITDFAVVGGQALFLKPEKLLYGIVVLVLETMVLDQVMLFGTAQIQIFAVSPHYEQIRLRLLTEIEAGVTMTMIETGCLEKQQKGVLCVIPNRKLYAATELIQEIDPAAFITVTKIKEVRGRGFTSAREPVEI